VRAREGGGANGGKRAMQAEKESESERFLLKPEKKRKNARRDHSSGKAPVDVVRVQDGAHGPVETRARERERFGMGLRVGGGRGKKGERSTEKAEKNGF